MAHKILHVTVQEKGMRIHVKPQPVEMLTQALVPIRIYRDIFAKSVDA
jgi:hypothetical protein